MSRHTIAHKTNPNVHFVVGYDRPANAFFCQVWDCTTDEGPEVDFCFDTDDLEALGAAVPSGLEDQLLDEVLGITDTNICRDWRTEEGAVKEAVKDA